MKTTEEKRKQLFNGTKAIEEWLVDYHARKINEFRDDLGNHFGYYLVKGKVIIIEYFSNGGWDAFIQASPSSEIGETLKTLEDYVK